MTRPRIRRSRVQSHAGPRARLIDPSTHGAAVLTFTTSGRIVVTRAPRSTPAPRA